MKKTDTKLTCEENEDVQKYQKAAKKVLTLSAMVSKLNEDGIELDGLIARCGDLDKLIKATAYVLRLMGRTPPPRHGVNLTSGMLDEFLKSGERKSIEQSISSTEYHDAWMFLICWEQRQRLDTKKSSNLMFLETQVELSSFIKGSKKLPQIILSPRVKNFPVSFSNNVQIPVIPYGILAKLIAKHYHNKYHTDIDSVVAHIRNDVWVVKIRKLVSSIDKYCKFCLIKRKKMAAQIMGNLPEFRFKQSSAFSAVCMDLFGPMIIRDDCVKRGPRIFKKVWGVLFTCTALRAVYLDVAMYRLLY